MNNLKMNASMEPIHPRRAFNIHCGPKLILDEIVAFGIIQTMISLHCKMTIGNKGFGFLHAKKNEKRETL